mgnify:FL=1|jgi:hypothetical protein
MRNSPCIESEDGCCFVEVLVLESEIRGAEETKEGDSGAGGADGSGSLVSGKDVPKGSL